MRTKLIFKKITSIILTLALLSTFAVCGSSVSAASSSDNLLANITASDWLQYKWNTSITDVSDSCYGGNAIQNSSVAYQNLYLPLELEANSRYELSFSVKAKEIIRSEIFALEKDASLVWAENNYLDATATKVYLRQSNSIAGVSETAWKDVKFTFETDATTDVQYYFNLHFGAAGTSNTATISDLSLVKAKVAEDDDNLVKDVKASDWLQYMWNTSITDVSDSCYGGNAIQNSSVAYQNLYLPLELEANSKYELSFSIKANEVLRTEVFALSNGGSPVWAGNNFLDDKATLEYTRLSNTISDTSETAWKDVKFTFETGATTDVQYYFNIHFGAGGDTNTATISDLSLVKPYPVDTGWLQHKFNTDIRYTDDSHLGGEAIINYTVAYQNLYRPIEVEANSKYELSFSIKANEVLRTEVFALSNGGSPVWAENNFLDDKATLEYTRLSTIISDTSETAWKDVKFTFETGATTDVQYYFNIHFGAGGDTNTATISDLSLVKTGITENALPNADEITSLIGNSMRSTGTQALRYKFSVEKSALETDYFGYSITEYGFIGAYDKYLTDDYGELTFNGNGELTNAKSVQGIAYQKSTGKDIMFAETDDVKIISSALTNIGLKNNAVDYNAYAMGITVRTYVIFENAEGSRIYKYGTGYSASVFGTMDTILSFDEQSAVEGGYSWEAVQQDQAAINEILASVANDTDESTELTVGDYYNSYISNKTE